MWYESWSDWLEKFNTILFKTSAVGQMTKYANGWKNCELKDCFAKKAEIKNW